MAKIEARILAAAVACLLTAAAWADEPQPSADATDAPAVRVGERVRLSGPSVATGAEPLIGQVVAVDAEAITVVKDKRTGETRRIPFASIRRLDVAQGRERRSLAGVGAGIGMAIPAAVAVVVASGKPSSRGDFAEAGPALVGAVIFVMGVPAGALIGAIIGSGSHTEVDHWERVATRRVRVSVLPDFRGGVRGGLSVRF